MPLKLSGATSGTITVDTPAVAGSNTLTLPAVTGNVITSADSGTVTPTMLSQKLTLMTAQNSTSGTSIDFTGIPSWVKRITMMLNGVSLSGTALIRFRLGTSVGFATSGYLGSGSVNSTGVATASQTAGFDAYNSTPVASALHSGSITFNLMDSTSNIWTANGIFGRSDTANIHMVGGVVPLSGVLTQVRMTSSNGTDTFDAGSVNVMYEG